MNQPHVFDTAQHLHALGIVVIPVRGDGTKAPAIREWQTYQPTVQDLDDWFRPQAGANGFPRYSAIGVVSGAASGNLEMAELEGRAMVHLPDLRELAHDSGIGDTWDKVSAGWVEQTPSGGIHWFYRVTGEDVPGNLKIAMRPSSAEELAEWKTDETARANKDYDGDRLAARLAKITAATTADVLQTLAETRGRGGQSVAAPTGGHAHDSGRPWIRLVGGPDSLPTLTADERDQFLTILGTLDRRPHPEPTPSTTPTGTLAQAEAGHRDHTTGDGISPGDDYEQKTTWAQLLEPNGWRQLFTRGTTIYWRRPGKDRGISATTGHADDRDRLYVFSSSTEFDTHTPYTKFGAYATLEHGGDHSAAAKSLAGYGFGETRTQAQAKSVLPETPQRPAGTPPPPTTQEQPQPQAAITITEEHPEWGDAGLRSHQRMATRLAERVTGRFLYVSGSGWHRWDGTRWAPDHRGTAINYEITRLFQESWREAQGDKDLAADVKSAQTANGTAGVLQLASLKPEISTEIVDADPWLLNTPTGTLDLHTLGLRPHNPADRITKITACGYTPEATSDLWDHFLETSLPNVEVREFLQRYAGLALIGKVVEHVLVIAHGNLGRNGKGVFSRTVEAALASYAITAPADLLIQSRHGDKRSAGELASIMRLRGARWVVMSELNKGVKMDEATMKSLTGGDRLEAKRMGKDPVEFSPSHTIFMSANDLPAVGADSTAAWARIRAVPWEISWDGREDTTLEDRLAAHLPAVLAWAVEGLRTYQRVGLAAPAAVLRETAKYRTDNDPVARFIEDECTTTPDATVGRAVLLEAYQKWARNGSEPNMSGRQLTAIMRTREGVQEFKSGTLAWRGIGLAAPAYSDPTPEPIDDRPDRSDQGY